MSLERMDKHIEELYKQWLSLQPLNNQDNERLWEKIRLDWNYNSNRIEGNTLTYKETKLLLDDHQDPVEGRHLDRDLKEMKAHDLAVEKIRGLAGEKQRYLTEADIRDLNSIILKGPFWKEAETEDGQVTRKKISPGKYKTQPNHVITETGEIFKFAIPEEVPVKMQELMEWFKESIESPPASIASFLAQLHHRFILIHPFDDGNGRIVRLLLNYALIRLGYPPFVIEDKDRRTYFAALQKADRGNIDALTIYLGRTLVSWLEIGIKAAEGKDISKPEDIDKKVDIFIRKKEAEGLKEVKSLSEQTKEELCDQSLIPLFEAFRNRLRQFNNLFNSNEISVKAPEDILDNFMMSMIDGETSFKEGSEENMIRLEILYRTYKDEKPFNIGASISAALYELKYRVQIRTYLDSSPDHKFVEREKIYTYIWTDSEIEEFVSEGKGLFFEKLKQRAGEPAD